VTILLVHLPVGFEESYPLALAAIAAPLIEAGYAVEGLDVARCGIDGLARRLDRGDVGVVGLSVWSPAVSAARVVAETVREAPGNPVLVLGGPHPTLAPDDVDADAVVLGEGEVTFHEVVDAVAAGRALTGIGGVHVRGVTGVSRETVDLATLPLPDRTIFGVADYHRDHLPTSGRYASDVTSRGCLYRCAFCSAPALWGRGHRYRPAEQVVESWDRLATDHGVTGVLVEDDLFTQRRERVIELCERLIVSQVRVTWELLNGVRPETLDAQLLDLMHQAGCTRLALSIESSSPERLKAMGRTPSLDAVRSAVEATRDAGIGATGYFMLGLPGETRFDREATFDFAASLPLDMAHFSVASAWPGTAWSAGDLSAVPAIERSTYYAAWYLHPVRAVRAARMLGVRPAQLPQMMGRLLNWMNKPLEARRAVVK